jgi:hypothetical protein
MRFILTALVWIVIPSLIFFVFTLRNHDMAELDDQTSIHAKAAFEITATFTTEKDPFALDIGSDGSFTVMLDGRTIFTAESGIKDRQAFRTEEFDITAGTHELFVKANPADTTLSNCVRIRAIVNGNPATDESYWFDPGQSVNASHIFSIKGDTDEH